NTNTAGSIGRHPDFARAIRIRKEEFAALAEHARVLGVAVPAGNLLDNELIFVNYRLMARRIGQPYPDMASDSALALWGGGMALALGDEYGWRRKLAHAAWLTVLLLAPTAGAARMLLRLRFGRAELLRPVRLVFNRLFGAR